jgi:hypothetical protein
MAVELDVNNADGRLSPGTFCQVGWARTSDLAISLRAAWQHREQPQDARSSFRVRGGRTEWVDVKTGLASGTLVEVFGDMRPGDEIASRGTDEIRAGMSVVVKQTKAA